MWFRKRDRDWRRDLREFIYLDEVSVTSLLAARDGEIPESVTDTLSRSVESESSLSASLPIKGMKLGAESRHKVADTTAQQVVRRAVVQSTFRTLHTGGGDKQRPFGDGTSRDSKLDGTIETLEELKRRSKKLRRAGALRRLDTMSRGDLVEFEVTLRPAKTFIAGHALESLARMMAGRPELFGDMAFQIAQATPMADVLNDLMVGLVPVRGVSTNISLLHIDGHAHLVDTRVFASGSQLAAAAEPVELVAQTEVASYWKDLRRILYSGNRYTVYARLTSPELRPQWRALKLNELLQDVSTEMGEAVAALETIVNDLFDGMAGKDEPTLDVRVMMHKFADALPGDLPENKRTTIDDAITAAVIQFRSAEGLANRRAAFDVVVEAHEKAIETALDRLDVAKIRIELAKATDAVQVAATLAGKSDEVNTAPQLEVDVVAIYW